MKAIPVILAFAVGVASGVILRALSPSRLFHRAARSSAQLADRTARETCASSSTPPLPPPPPPPAESSRADSAAQPVKIPLSSALPLSHIARFSRQLILDEIGIEGQRTLAASSVLIVGAGGLGCPAMLYLAAAGVGRLGIVDHDIVALDNLHRQVAHTEAAVGQLKVDSARDAVHRIHSGVIVDRYPTALSADNAEDLVHRYDVVLDCTDNVATRYLLNDACVLQGRPLVSGSALRLDGQLTVYHRAGGPCYRCLHPAPPPAATVTNCADGGVLGMIPGVIGVLQALLAVHVLLRHDDALRGRMLVLDGARVACRSVQLRLRRADCAVCGESPSIHRVTDVDYPTFCGAPAHDAAPGPLPLVTDPALHVSAAEYAALVRSGQPHVLLDVRPARQHTLVALQHSLSIPFAVLEERIGELDACTDGGRKPVYVMCRRGNDSQRAVLLLQRLRPALQVRNVRGGVTAWRREVDPDFPSY